MKRILTVITCLIIMSGCAVSDSNADESIQTLESTESAAIESSTLAESTELIAESSSESIDPLESIYNDLKSTIDETTSELEFSSGMTEIIVNEFEESYGFVSTMNKFSDYGDNEDFVKFMRALSYFDINFEDGTVGKQVGEQGWDAIRSLILDDGQFHAKMEDLKTTYELSGRLLFDTFYNAGQYKIGQDIPSGEYVIFAESGAGYFVVTSDSNGDDIIANDNFDYNAIISVNDGEYLELSRSKAVPIEEVVSLPLDRTNMYKIGVHLSAGEYKVMADSDNGYYCIYNDSRHEDIEANDNFSGQAYVTVRDGQYLLLSGCHLEQ